MIALPIDEHLPAIVAALRGARAVVVEAPPGAGKTTRVPRAMLEAGLADTGEILILQPRRLPARMAAERVAAELGERPGQRVGYTVRFEDVSGPQTRLRFITEGVLVRRLLADPGLPGVAAVVLDEFHERHLATDLSLSLLRRLQQGARPDLRLVVMSATLDAGPVRQYLDNAPGVRSEGRLYDVGIEYLSNPDTRPLQDQVVGIARDLVREGLDGDVLVFLPGAGEIRRAMTALEDLGRAHNLLVVPLHGELSPAEQSRAVRLADRRKIILSTNVAETSVTIDGVTVVVDAGLARMASHSPWTGLSRLAVGKISQAAAIQRAGRAGRTRPGRAIRLYTRHDFETRRGYDTPEIERLDLTEPCLVLHACGVRDPGTLDWFERPRAAALAAADELLHRLGAVAAGGDVTPLGRDMLRFPVHPRLARLMVEAERRGVGEAGAVLAALVSEGDINSGGRVRFGGGGGDAGGDGADALDRVERFFSAKADRFSNDSLRSWSLDGRAAEAVDRVRKQLAGVLRGQRPGPRTPALRDEALGACALAGFPDRVARRRGPHEQEVVLSTGTVAFAPFPPDEILMVALSVEERVFAHAPRGRATIGLAVAITAEALIEIVPDAVIEEDSLVFNPERERVERVSSIRYGSLTLEETRRSAEPSPEASRVLGTALKGKGAALLGGEAGLPALAARCQTLREAMPELELPPLDEAAVEKALVAACEGCTTLDDVRAQGLEDLLLRDLPAATRQALRTEVPLTLSLPGGRSVPVHYSLDRPPYIESRLHDFFGMKVGPMICRGRVPLVLHLLSPNHRAVQVTRDLAGFWTQHYPAIRRELCRKYPRHPWPEDGATATPPHQNHHGRDLELS